MWRCVKNGKTNDPGFNASGRQASPFSCSPPPHKSKNKVPRTTSGGLCFGLQRLLNTSTSRVEVNWMGHNIYRLTTISNAGKVGKYQTRLCCQPVPSSQFQLSLSSFSQVLVFHAWWYCGTTSPLLSRDFYIGFKAFRMSDYVFMAGLHNICFPCLFGGFRKWKGRDF